MEAGYICYLYLFIAVGHCPPGPKPLSGGTRRPMHQVSQSPLKSARDQRPVLRVAAARAARSSSTMAMDKPPMTPAASAAPRLQSSARPVLCSVSPSPLDMDAKDQGIPAPPQAPLDCLRRAVSRVLGAVPSPPQERRTRDPETRRQLLRVTCWNVNGVRAATRKGLVEWLSEDGPDFIALQEVRALPHQIPAELSDLGLRAHWEPAERPGYSGVGWLSAHDIEAVQLSLPRRFRVEGRASLVRCGALWLCSVYVPKGSGTLRDNSRVPYKLAFSRALRGRLQPLVHAGERVVVLGDFNTAHQEIDLARPRQNRDNSGFLPGERRDFAACAELCRRAQASFPPHPEYDRMLGESLLAEGQRDEGLAALGRYLEATEGEEEAFLDRPRIEQLVRENEGDRG